MIFAILFICGVLGWFFSTVAAGGAATILIPVIALLISAEVVAPTISIAAIMANPSRAFFFRKCIDWQVIKYLLPGSIIGAMFGAWSLANINIQVVQIIISVFLITYVLQDKLSKVKLSVKMKLGWFLPLGLSVSFISGLIGATGPVHNPFMLSYGLEKEYLVGTKAINSFVMQVTKLISYGIFGALSLKITAYGVILGIGAVLGVYLARNHLKNIDEDRFRQYNLLLMFISGVFILWQAIP